MALAQPPLEEDAPKALLGGASPRRPLFLMGAVVCLVGVLVILTKVFSSPSADAGESDSQLTVPDDTSARRVRTLAVAPDAAVQIEVPSEEGLGVTDNVPKLPGDVAGSPGAFAAQRRALVEQYALRVEQATLESRFRARGAPLGVSSFARVVRRPGDDAVQALAMLQGAGADPSAGADLGAGLEGLQPGVAGLAQGGLAPAISGLLGAVARRADQPPVLTAADSQDPNHTAAKNEFFRSGGKQLEPGRLQSTVRSSSPYSLLMGHIIPGILITGINSEAAGVISGQVSEDVFDTATGSHLLVPQGSKLVGTYHSVVSQGQRRVQVAWVRLNFRDGRTLDLEGMAGSDQAGTSGFRDRVNLHFGQRLAAALLTTAMTVGYEVTAPQNGSLTEGAVHRGVGESIVQLGTDMSRQAGQIPPTLEIRPGYRFTIVVNKDIPMTGPYEDGFERRRGR